MAYCSASEVRLIIDTGLTDTELASLIALADAEIDARGLNTTLSANVLKQVSMLITASLAAMNYRASYGKADYSAGGQGLGASEYFRRRAEELIQRSETEIPLYQHNEPVSGDSLFVD